MSSSPRFCARGSQIWSRRQLAPPRAQADASAARSARAEGGPAPVHDGGPVVQPARCGSNCCDAANSNAACCNAGQLTSRNKGPPLRCRPVTLSNWPWLDAKPKGLEFEPQRERGRYVRSARITADGKVNCVWLLWWRAPGHGCRGQAADDGPAPARLRLASRPSPPCDAAACTHAAAAARAAAGRKPTGCTSTPDPDPPASGPARPRRQSPARRTDPSPTTPARRRWCQGRRGLRFRVGRSWRRWSRGGATVTGQARSGPRPSGPC